MEGIKEIKELIAGVQMLAVAVKKIAADGKVDIVDLPIVIDALSKFSVLVAAVEGVGSVPAEIKDIDGAEAQELLNQILTAAAAIKAA